MYNPDTLTKALETTLAAEQAMLDSLRGPDAAQRITDDQIRAIITSPSFKSRHGRYHPRNRLHRRRRECTDLLLSI